MKTGSKLINKKVQDNNARLRYPRKKGGEKVELARGSKTLLECAGGSKMDNVELSLNC